MEGKGYICSLERQNGRPDEEMEGKGYVNWVWSKVEWNDAIIISKGRLST